MSWSDIVNVVHHVETLILCWWLISDVLTKCSLLLFQMCCKDRWHVCSSAVSGSLYNNRNTLIRALMIHTLSDWNGLFNKLMIRATFIYVCNFEWTDINKNNILGIFCLYWWAWQYERKGGESDSVPGCLEVKAALLIFCVASTEYVNYWKHLG